MRRFSTPKRRRSYFKAWWRSLLVTALIVLILALFAVRFFFIQGNSMKGTLLPGDMVFVDKLSYGARLPLHPIAIPYSDRLYLSSLELPYIRMPGFAGLQRKDLIAFDHPMGPMELPKDKRRVLIKRCVGLPGDTLAILGGTVRVNGKPLERPPGVIVHYHMKVRRAAIADSVFEEYGIEKPIKLSNRGDYVVPLTRKEARRSEADPLVSFVDPWQGDMVRNSVFFPDHPAYPWRPGKVGPLWVPEKGETVALDTNSLPLYERIIEVYGDHR
ncbi:MAG: signal peptidase I, partial [Flavobacteriales bacterium]